MNKTELLKRFGKNIKIERIRHDLTQEQCAEINYFTCIENGRQNMSLGKILELTQKLKFKLSAVLNFEDND